LAAFGLHWSFRSALQPRDWIIFLPAVILSTSLAGLRGAPLRAADGEIVGVRRIFHDITRRKAGEEALQQSERHYRSLFENRLNGFAYCRMHYEEGKTSDFTFIEVNPAFETLTGLKHVEGKRATEVIPGIREADSELMQRCGHTARTGEPERFEHYIETLKMWFAISIYSPSKDHFVVVFDVITQRKQAEQALRLRLDLQNQLAQVAATVPGMIYSWRLRPDGSMSIPYASPALEALFGLKHEAVRDDATPLLSMIHPDDVARVKESIAASAQSMTSWRMEFRVRHTCTGERWMEGNSVPQLEPDGGILWNGFVQDITDRKHADQQLRQLSSAVEQSYAAVVIVNRRGDIEYVNSRFVELTGYSFDEVRGKNPRFLRSGEIPASDYARLWRTVTRGEVWRGEFHNRRKDGTFFWESASVSPVTDETGRITHFLAVKEDITERKQTETALKLFRALIERSGDAIYVVDPATGSFLDVNARAFESLGYTREELLALKVFDIAPEVDSELFKTADARMSSGEQTTLEVMHRRKDGTIFPVEVRLSHVALDRDYLVANVRDIAERNQRNGELRWKTALLEAQADSALDGILVVDGRNQRILENQRLVQMFNVPEDIVKETDNTKFLQHAVLQTKNPEQFSERVAHLYAHPEEIGRDEIELADGRILDRYSAPVRDEAGTYYGRIWSHRDITDQRQLEAQLRQSQKMEGIGQLAGGVAHDFNNILGAMMLQSELAEKADDVPEMVREDLRQIRAAVERAANLTRQLLLFSRKQVMQPRDLDLNDVVTSLARMLQRIIGEDMRLLLNLHPRPLMSRADAGMVDQVLMNLTINARDAMPHGGRITIETAETTVDENTVRLNPDAAPGRYVSMKVRDEGIGIPPENLARIFEPFFTTKEEGKGTGLGLATVFGIVKQHHGWVTVESEPGLGTTFHIHLPACEKDLSGLDETLEDLDPCGGDETILVTEDESNVRELIQKLLEHHGYRVLVAGTGPEALQVWRDHGQGVALLLTDLVMPGGMSGTELARRLQADNPDLKVIFMTGYSEEIAGRALGLGSGENFLQKPFAPCRLLETVRQSLDPCLAAL
jgi:PAS domain S-box-containing protein